jgi:hypothetical protein
MASTGAPASLSTARRAYQPPGRSVDRDPAQDRHDAGEVVISNDGLGDIIIGEFVVTREEAERAASQAAYDAVPRYR